MQNNESYNASLPPQYGCHTALDHRGIIARAKTRVNYI